MTSSFQQSQILKRIMKKPTLLNYLLSAILLGSTLTAQAEPVLLKAQPQGSKVRIEGTSTMHDWTMEGSLIGGSVRVPEGFPLEPGQTVEPGKVEAAVEAVIPITSLKSVKDGKPYNTKMDEIAHEKLGKPAHKKISYQLVELTLKEASKDAASPYLFEASGNLVVGGVTNLITLPVEVTPLEDGKVKFATKTPLKMSDYKIKGPELTFLGIGIKTGDDVTITIEWMTARAK
jgi:hypothetical protein